MKPGDLVRIKRTLEVRPMASIGVVCLLVKLPTSTSNLGIARVIPLGAENTEPIPIYLRYLEVVEKADE